MVEHTLSTRFEPPSCRTGGEERRVMCRMLGRWSEWGGATAAVPAWVFDAEQAPDLAPHLYALRLASPPIQSSFLRCGSVLADVCGGDPLGRTLTEVLPRLLASTMADFLDTLLEYRQPLADSGAFLLQGREILYRNVLMPVAEVAGEPAQLIGAFSFRSAAP